MYIHSYKINFFEKTIFAKTLILFFQNYFFNCLNFVLIDCTDFLNKNLNIFYNTKFIKKTKIKKTKIKKTKIKKTNLVLSKE
jgi:hypothetical protein